MTVRIKRQTVKKGLIDAVQEASGVDLAPCYQCRKCTAGCPVAGISRSGPAEIVRRLQLGAGDELLENDIIWLCLSCETCYARCPMKINVAAVMDALRILSLARKTLPPRGDMPLFNRTFLSMVKRFGRAYDLPTIALYKLRTGNIAQDTEKLPMMLKKRKIAVLPPSGADKQTVKRVFRATRPGGTSG
ncbi:MAG: 4Fe-4S dicluster domain-containing protein [Chloroflexi bacterium]|nr:4Fe-4S dicluster domain-containing protein [Chloroflexota bacterium]